MNTAPNRSQWEIVQSWWVLLPFFGLGWLAFLYIGLRTGYKKWQLLGILYLLPFLLLLLTSGSVLGQVAGLLVALDIIATIFHVFFVRRPFLVRLEALLQQNLQRNEILYQLQEWGTLARGLASTAQSSSLRDRLVTFVKEDSGVTMATGATQQHSMATTTFTAQPQASTGRLSSSPRPRAALVDINSADEEEIAGLPGMTDILAKKVVSLRRDRGGFGTLDEFSEALGLKPHVVEHLRPHVTFSHGMPAQNNVSAPDESSQERVREIDVGTPDTPSANGRSPDRGREIDF